MIGGEPSCLLKTGRSGPKSTKQAKTRLAILLKFLEVACFSRENPLAGGGKHKQRLWA
jgi:hypothetical protein